MTSSDTDIINHLKKDPLQRRTAETKLFKEYQYFIANATKKHALNTEELQSVYCDSFMAVVEQILDGRFEGGSTIKTFFYRIFSNKCIDAVRKKTTNKEKVHDTDWVENWVHLSSRAANALKSIIQKEMVEEVNQAFQNIGKTCNAILTKWGQGYSAAEIATLLGYKSAQSVRTTKSRCMEKLLENKKGIAIR